MLASKVWVQTKPAVLSEVISVILRCTHSEDLREKWDSLRNVQCTRIAVPDLRCSSFPPHPHPPAQSPQECRKSTLTHYEGYTTKMFKTFPVRGNTLFVHTQNELSMHTTWFLSFSTGFIEHTNLNTGITISFISISRISLLVVTCDTGATQNSDAYHRFQQMKCLVSHHIRFITLPSLCKTATSWHSRAQICHTARQEKGR